MEKSNQFLELGHLIDLHLKSEELVIVDIIKMCDHYVFGKVKQGMHEVTKPIETYNSQNFYQYLYDWISKEYIDKIEYGYSHSFSGEYNYHFEIGENFMLRLLGESSEDKNWIHNRIQMDTEVKRG